MPAIGQSAGALWLTVDAVIHTNPPVCWCLFGVCPSASWVVPPVRLEGEVTKFLIRVFGREVAWQRAFIIATAST